jgi:hypothetical protein
VHTHIYYSLSLFPDSFIPYCFLLLCFIGFKSFLSYFSVSLLTIFLTSFLSLKLIHLRFLPTVHTSPFYPFIHYVFSFRSLLTFSVSSFPSSSHFFPFVLSPLLPCLYSFVSTTFRLSSLCELLQFALYNCTSHRDQVAFQMSVAVSMGAAWCRDGARDAHSCKSPFDRIIVQVSGISHMIHGAKQPHWARCDI